MPLPSDARRPHTPVALLIILSVLFLWLRIPSIGHLLMWDEAWNILSLRAFILGADKSPFFWYYYFHPPLYLNVAQLLGSLQPAFDIRIELWSLVVAYGTFLVTYFLSRKIGGWKYATWTALCLAVLPVALGYDTWVKSDGLASCFGYLAILLLLNKRIFWCGVALGFSLLSKESAFFFIIAATILIVFLREGRVLGRIVSLYAIAGSMASWWYLFCSELTFNLRDFYFSASQYSDVWMRSASYYVIKLLPDIGIMLVPFFLIGMLYLCRQIARAPRSLWLVPLIIFATIYVPISLVITTKTPWLSWSAAPALAMIAGAGAWWVTGISTGMRLQRIVITGIVILLVASGVTFSYTRYHAKVYAEGVPGAQASYDLACYLNEHMRPDDKILISDFTYWQMPVCPVFFYYWQGAPVMRLRGDESAASIVDAVIKKKIAWVVVVDSPDPVHNLHALVRNLRQSALGEPTVVGWSCVWDTRRLWLE